MPRSHPPEFRRKVLDLVASGRPIKQVAEMLGISDQTVYNRRRRHLIDTGQAPGIPQQRERGAGRGTPTHRGAGERAGCTNPLTCGDAPADTNRWCC